MQLLQLLEDGEVHSGEALGAALGITRTAVWKQLSVLRKRGLVIEVVPGRGYRLLRPFEPWSDAALRDGLGEAARAALAILSIRDRMPSTNDEVLALLRDQGTPPGAVVCLAEEQTAGRGRRGREWLSPLGGNFYGSVGWVFPGGVQVVEGLSLAVGVAVLRALRRYGVTTARLKWPNDIVVGEAKLGGVLIELLAESDGPCRVVVGLGLNLQLPQDMSGRLGRPVTDVVSQLATPLERNRLGALLLDELLQLLLAYPAGGFAAFRDEWLHHDALRNAPVEVAGLQEGLQGMARGVDGHGALLLETADGVQALHGGEVSLRKR